MRRTIIIREDIADGIFRKALNEAFCPDREQVKLVKSYLDKNYMKFLSDDLDNNGNPTVRRSVIMMIHGQPKSTFISDESLLMKMKNDLPSLLADEKDNEKFLKTCIDKWFRNEIDSEGVMKGVNFIK